MQLMPEGINNGIYIAIAKSSRPADPFVEFVQDQWNLTRYSRRLSPTWLSVFHSSDSSSRLRS
jgi:hypothetical protein